MKRKPQLMVMLVVCLAASIAGYANDSVTGLPVYPGAGSPEPLPKATFCGKQMDGSFYIVLNRKGEKVKLVAAWYARHLTAFHAYHANTDGRTQDTFFNKDGTKEVTITSNRGNGDEVFSVSYGKFRPGLSAAEMASFNHGGRDCN
jgi:hypothetical protein